IEVAEALPDLDACRRPENLLFGLAPPPAPVAAAVTAVRDQLARARTLELLGRDEEALAGARLATATAERLGYPPGHAQAVAPNARAPGPRGAPGALALRGPADARAESERLYFEALDLAEAERHDQLAAEIWGKLVLLAVRMD